MARVCQNKKLERVSFWAGGVARAADRDGADDEDAMAQIDLGFLVLVFVGGGGEEKSRRRLGFLVLGL
jgi:hypothetical protein